jgi:hypothetical protein
LPDQPLHVCGECGCLLPDVQRALATRDQMVDVLREDVASLEAELRSKRAAIKRLKSDQDRSLRADPRYDEAMNVLSHWRATCAPQARELGGKRLENVLARLHGKYTSDQLKRSAEGYALKPYVVNGRRQPSGPKDDWRADAELIYRDAAHVDQGMRIADQADVLRAEIGPRAVASTTPDLTEELGELGKAALRVARAGWAVFPVRPRDKAPATRNGLLDAKSDVAAVTATWKRWPDLNIGLRCGRESGLVILDVDGDEGFESLHELEKVHDKLPKTLSVKTPRGGSHFYFQHPGVEIRNTAGFPGPGLDVRGDGGYVLCPPSIHPNGGVYEVDDAVVPAAMPDWLKVLLLKRQSGAQERKPAEHWAGVAANGAREGTRNDTAASYVGHLVSLGMEEPEVRATIQMWNKQNIKPPLTDKELSAVVDSIFRVRERAV